MTRIRLRLLSTATLALLLTIFSATGGGAAGRRVVPGALHQKAFSEGSARVIVHLNAPFTLEAELDGAAGAAAQRQGIASVRNAVKAALKPFRHRIAREYSALPFLTLEAGPDALQMLEARRGIVISVEEERVDRVGLAQSGPIVQAPQAWSAGFDGTNSIVAVLDTGVDKTHPFLAGKVVAEACFSTNTTDEGLSVTSMCPGGASTSTAPNSGLHCSSAVEGCDHGTHVAGIVAGGAIGGTPAPGIAPGAEIMAIQVFSRFPAAHSYCDGFNDCALSFSGDQLAALNHVFNQRNAFPGKRIAAVNMSLGGGKFTSQAACASDMRNTAMGTLKTAGIATIVASGNNGYTDAMSSPACSPTAVSVGSTQDFAPVDRVSSFSNSASFLSLLAPGHFTASSVPGGTMEEFAGTSMATPHVAAAFAILRQAAPAATVDDIVAALQSTGTAVTDTRGPCPSCTTSGQVRRRINIAAALAALSPTPDLTVTALSSPTHVAPGNQVTLTYTVRNNGTAPSTSSVIAFYLSTDTSIGDGADTLVASANIGALGPGMQTSGASITFTIPSDTQARAWFVGAMADSNNSNEESNEANNTRVSTSFQVVRPDVSVTAATGPAFMSPGQTYAVSTTVKNNSSLVGFPASFLRLYLSTDATLDDADVLLGERTIPALLVNASSTGATAITIPGNESAGARFIIAVAGTDESAVESNDTNNTKTLAFSIALSDVQTVTATTAAAGSPGSTIAVSNTVKNNSTAVVGSFRVGLYFSTDALWDGTDTLVGTRTVSSLAPGAVSTASTPVRIPQNTAEGGHYRILVVADDLDGLPEGNESNNVLVTSAINVVQADLIVQTVTVPLITAPNQTVAVATTIRNAARAPSTAVASTALLYLSPNSEPADLGTLVGSRTVSALGAFAVSTVSTSVNLGNVSPGTYYVKVVADADGVVTESDETNNVRVSAAISVGRDLTVTAATTVATASPGQTLLVTNAVKNNSTAAVASFRVGLYLSTDTTLDGDDLLLATRTTPALLAAGAVSSAGTAVVVPSSMTPGLPFHILVVADDLDAVEESIEGNNALATRAINVVLADLAVAVITTPSIAAPGQLISVSHAIRNQAVAPATAVASTASLYLSDNNSATGALGMLLANRSVPQLGPLAQSAATTPVLLGNVSPGIYYIKVVADAPGVVTESDESDNVGVSNPISVGRDLSVTAATTSITAALGQTVVVTNTVKNNSTASVASFRVGLYLSADATLDAGDVLLATRTTPTSLAAGAVSMAATSVIVPGNTPPGPGYRILVVADDLDAVEESTDTNNTLATGAINVVDPLRAAIERQKLLAEQQRLRDEQRLLEIPAGYIDANGEWRREGNVYDMGGG